MVSLLDDFRGSRFSRLLTHMLMLAGALGVECGELDCAIIFWDVVGALILVCAAA